MAESDATGQHTHAQVVFEPTLAVRASSVARRRPAVVG
jgi:hypothetical protein